jgi:glutamate-1-semialdehyde aminotransferase
LSHRFDVDDLDALDEVLEARPGGFACVLMMPFEEDEVTPDVLERTRSIAHRHGALFILDEMRSGFRVAVGGAQEHFGVHSDLATFSKAMANGYSISALTGRLDVLDSLAHTKISSTFFANPADMAAAITTIGILRDTDALDRIWTMGRMLQSGLREMVAESDLPVAVVGYPPMPFLRFEVDDPALRSMLERAFFAATTRGGVLFHPRHQWFLSAAHTEQDIDATLDVCRIAFGAAAQVAEAG